MKNSKKKKREPRLLKSTDISIKWDIQMFPPYPPSPSNGTWAFTKKWETELSEADWGSWTFSKPIWLK